MVDNTSQTGRLEGASLRPPRVSVIIPAYKSAAFIVSALDSVFAQTFQDFEVIVVNASSPDTEDLERALQPYFHRIVYLMQPNLGPAADRNAGIRRAQGEYVAFLDSDDGWDAGYLESQLRLLESEPGLNFVFADLRLVGDPRRVGMTYMQECPSRGPATFESILCEQCQVPTSATVARRQAVIDAGLFDESLRGSEDYDLWLRIARLGGRILYQRQVLATRRLHGSSLSADPQIVFETAAFVLAKLDRELTLSEQQRSLVRHRKAFCEAQADVIRGKRLLRQGDTAQAKDCLERANAVLGGFKLRVAIMTLRVAPGLAKTGAVLWARALQATFRQ